MSIATLKRKTQAKYNNMSVNTNGFSLNGTRRNQGYVGQTSLSRSLIRGFRNGPDLRGHGGCCSTGKETPIVQNDVCCLNDNSIVKKSSLSTMGMLKTRHCNRECNIVKPDTNNNVNSQSDQIQRKKKECLTCTISTVNPECNPNENNITKPDDAYLIMSSSNHTTNLNKACTENDVISVPYSVKKQPFAGFN
tara:strand:- start:304 stop:882 length:579 start_codon:yes stop_codon:yes gene_type:complete